MTSGIHLSRTQLIEQLVLAMVTHLTTIGVSLRDLAADPAAVVVTVDDIVLDWVDPGQVGAGCSVAALYSGTEVPPRIAVVWAPHRAGALSPSFTSSAIICAPRSTQSPTHCGTFPKAAEVSKKTSLTRSPPKFCYLPTRLRPPLPLVSTLHRS
jgi:hypothetical protein